ncbi:MAG TPA: glycosyl transferase [Anaerolineaceae bacterium]|nr:glycosyl transferase [Anaerolineaceae bacterium]
MKCGYFDIENREYVITDPQTPVKWINYIGTREFGGFVDHTGGALICKDDPTLNRITKYIQQMPSSDFKGETLYLRIHRTDGYQIFSPFYVPTLQKLDQYECHIGLGYTRILSQYAGIETEVTIFVPEKEKCEIRDIKIRNLSEIPVHIDIIPVVEYTHPDALKQFTNADWIPQTMQSKAVIENDGTVVLIQYPFMHRDSQINFFSSNSKVSSFESDRKLFLGENEYGSFKKPLALTKKELSNSEALRGDNIAALLHPLGVVEPSEEKSIITVLGQTNNLDSARSVMRQFSNEAAIGNELAKLSAFWDRYLDTIQVHSPAKDLDVMVNIFNPRQCFTTFTWSRYLSYYQLGLGSRGIGIRDSSQDLLAVIAAIPEETKTFLELLLSYQKQDGSAMHQFNPLSNIGSCGDSAEMEDRYHYYSDDHLWIVLAVMAYIKETADLDFLHRTIPFYEKDRDQNPIESASVLDHIHRALDFTQNNVGRHALPLLGFADWNDTVNLPKGAESLFVANLYGFVLEQLIPVVEICGKTDLAAYYKEKYHVMREKVESSSWDGEWYLRYFDHAGNPIGSSQNKYCQMYLNAQTWPVLSGFASKERAQHAMAAVYDKLFTPHGIKISTPPFDGYDPVYGGITTFPSGVKENGGIFVHPNPWAMMAETLLGNGNRAFEYYQATNPASHNDEIERYECEPYVYPQNIIADNHPQFGLARNSWLTGAAAWHYIAATQYILGIRPEVSGLRIDPCIPSKWDGLTITRKFRGKTYTIIIHNPHHVCKGVSRVAANGKEILGTLLNPDEMEKENQIEVWLGIK